jgi:putative transposase
MPNHYHFLIYATNDSDRPKLIGNIETCELSNGFRLLQSSYAKYINKQRNLCLTAKAVPTGTTPHIFHDN